MRCARSRGILSRPSWRASSSLGFPRLCIERSGHAVLPAVKHGDELVAPFEEVAIQRGKCRVQRYRGSVRFCSSGRDLDDVLTYPMDEAADQQLQPGGVPLDLALAIGGGSGRRGLG